MVFIVSNDGAQTNILSNLTVANGRPTPWMFRTNANTARLIVIDRSSAA